MCEVSRILRNISFSRLCALCREFEYHGWDADQYSRVIYLLKWCESQGQIDHLCARVAELRRKRR